MSNITQEADNSQNSNTGETIEAKIQSQFNEEKWTRIAAKDVSISRFKLLEAIFLETIEQDKKELLLEESKNQILEYEPSVAARYFIGMLALKDNKHEDIIYLKQLLDQFQEAAKWAVVEYLSDKMLAENENRTILYAKAMALEKLGKSKESIPVLEKLAKIDKKNPEIALKYADAIINEDLDKGVQYYKQAAEAFAKNLNIERLKTIWNKLIELIPNDFTFYKKIERILNGQRQKETIADLYVQLAHVFIKKEDVDNIIDLSKKILTYNPNYARFKSELVKSLKTKYESHSLLEDFLKYSGLLDTRKNTLTALGNFETNIVFDKGNYVFHRNWDVGQILEITNEYMVISFADKKEHKMEIQMALKALKPLTEDHFWVQYYQDPDKIKNMFEEDIVSFFKVLIISFGNKISLADIKAEVANKFIPIAKWSKWWTKTRAVILKDPLISVSSQKRDIIEYSETTVSNSDQAIDRFQAVQSFEEKLATAISTLKDTEECEDALEFMVTFFKEGLKSLDLEVQVESLIILDMLKDKLQDEEAYYTPEAKSRVIENLKKLTIHEVAALSVDFKSSDLKKEYAKIVKTSYKEWQKVYVEMLFHVPIKIHKTLISELASSDSATELKEFFNRLRKDAKQHAEIFLWTFKNLLTNTWDNLELDTKEYVLGFFRLVRNIEKIEKKGTKLRNLSKDIITGTLQENLMTSIKDVASESVRKISALFKDVDLFNEIEKDKFVKWLISVNPSLFEDDEDSHTDKAHGESIADYLEKNNKTIASVNAIQEMQSELDEVVNVEMPKNSKEIGVAQEKGDLRENAEYKAAMEKQEQLQALISKLEGQIKEPEKLVASQIMLDSIGVGVKVKLNDEKTGYLFVYTIMDQWDADIDKGIISYKSPLGKALLGVQVNDVIDFGSGEDEQRLKVLGLERAVDAQGNLI